MKRGHAGAEAHLSTPLCTERCKTELKNAPMFRIYISVPAVYYVIDGARKLSVAHCTICNMDVE